MTAFYYKKVLMAY